MFWNCANNNFIIFKSLRMRWMKKYCDQIWFPALKFYQYVTPTLLRTDFRPIVLFMTGLKHIIDKNYMLRFFFAISRERCEVKSKSFTKLSLHFKSLAEMAINFSGKWRKYDHGNVRKRMYRDMSVEWLIFANWKIFYVISIFYENVSYEAKKQI